MCNSQEIFRSPGRSGFAKVIRNLLCFMIINFHILFFGGQLTS